MASSIPDEKHAHDSGFEVAGKSKSSLDSGTGTGLHEKEGHDLDKAYVFLAQHNVNGDDSVDLKALRRKVDWRIVPIMFLCYTMQFVDKVNINVSLS